MISTAVVAGGMAKYSEMVYALGRREKKSIPHGRKWQAADWSRY